MRIRDLAGDPPGVISNADFLWCEILGPAIIAPRVEDVDFDASDFAGTPDSGLHILDDRTDPIQAIPMQNCRFISCNFREGIEVAGRRADLERFGLLPSTQTPTPRPAGPTLPAVCTQCGTAFEVPLPFGLDEGGSILATGNWAGPCPVCGGVGRIPNGLYEFVATAVPLVEQATQDERDALVEAVQALIAQAATRDQAVEVIESTPGPWKKLGAALTSQEAGALYGLLSVLLTIVFRYL